MIYEVTYNPIISDKFEDHVKNVFRIDYEKDCFVFFYLGEEASKFLNEEYPNLVTAHLYIKELEKRAESDMKIAFSMFPTTLDDLMSIADAGKVMPPKSTWFEPKLLSGLFIHKLK